MSATLSLKHGCLIAVGAALWGALGTGLNSVQAEEWAKTDPVELLFNQEPKDDPAPDALMPRRGGPPEGRGIGARPEGRGFGLGIWRRLSEEEQAELYAFVKENFPEVYEELEQLRGEESRRFHRRMARLAPKLLDLVDLMDLDPERGALAVKEYKLEIGLRVLLLRYHKSDDETQRAELRAHIKPIVAQKVECRRERHEQEIRDLEARIAQLRRRLDKSAANQEELVEKLLERLLSAPPPEDEPGGQGHRGGRRNHGWDQRERPGPPLEPDESEPSPED